MINHIEPQDIEKLIISPEEFTHEERGRHIEHIESCALCKEHFSKLKDFYSGFEKELSSPHTERDKAFAQKLLSRRRLALPWKRAELPARDEKALDTYYQIIEPYKRPLPQRIFRYIQLHPLRFVGATSFASIAMVLAFLLIKPTFKDTNPEYARAKDEFLVVYNKNGEELWRKHIHLCYDLNRMQKENLQLDDCIQIKDVDQDGKNEVITHYGFLPDTAWNNKIICYNTDNTQRWKYELHRNMVFGSEKFSDDFHFISINVGYVEEKGTSEIIALALADLYYPTVLLKLNAVDGNFISEYWHTGNLTSKAEYDIDKDNVKEIILGGCNNGYDQASLTILDKNYIIGHSPCPAQYKPNDISLGREKYYILFPRTDLKDLTQYKRNRVHGIYMTKEGFLRIHVVEDFPNGIMYPLIYYFNSKMNCIKVVADDKFLTFHNQLEAIGKLRSKVDERYLDEMRKGIQYWDGEKFVNTPTKNSLYTKSVNLP
jgi:hypothetical protein